MQLVSTAATSVQGFGQGPLLSPQPDDNEILEDPVSRSREQMSICSPRLAHWWKITIFRRIVRQVHKELMRQKKWNGTPANRVALLAPGPAKERK